MHSVCRLKYFIFSIIAPIPKPFPLVFWAANSVFNQKKTEKDKFQHNFNGFHYLVTEELSSFSHFLWASLCLFATNHFYCELRHKNEKFAFISLSTATVFLLSFKTQLLLPQTIPPINFSHLFISTDKCVQSWASFF